jgi:hypothetical protein
MDKARWWDRWHVRTGALGFAALVLILWFFLSPTKVQDAGTTVVHVADGLAAIAAAVGFIGGVFKFARGKPAPEAEQTLYAPPPAAITTESIKTSRTPPRLSLPSEPASMWPKKVANALKILLLILLGIGTFAVQVVLGALKMLLAIGTVAVLTFIFLLDMCVPAAVGWLVGGHGVHLLGDNIRDVNKFSFPALLIIAVFAGPIGVGLLWKFHHRDSVYSDLDFGSGYAFSLVASLCVFAAFAIVSWVFHADVSSEASHFLGIEHGSQLVCDWLALKF